MTVVMMGQMSLDNSVEKSEKKNEWNEAGSLFQRQGNERSEIFKEEDDDGRERVTEEERVSIKGESTEIKFRR